MADNVAVTAGSGTTISTEEVTTLNGGAVSAQHVQRMAAALRTADGVAIDLPGDAANGLDVDVTRLPALVAGTATIGSVKVTDGTTVAVIKAASTAAAAADPALVVAVSPNNVLKVGDGTTALVVKAASTAAVAADVSAVVALSPNSPLPAGTNNIGDIDVLTLPALTVLAAATSTPHAVVSLGNSQGKTVVGATGTLASTAVTANQTIATRTVTAAKTFYVTSVDVTARLTTFAATATLYGVVSLRIGGTAVASWELAAAGLDRLAQQFGEPLPVAAGVVVDLVVTPAATTAFTWRGSVVGYEK